MYINHKIRIENTEEYLISKQKIGREVYWKTNFNQIKQKNLKNLECMCVSCTIFFKIKLNHNLLKREKYICVRCNTLGENNPFYGKKHTEKFKKEHSDFMKGKMSGEKNSFYGKTHSDVTKKFLSERLKGKMSGENNPFYGKTHSDATRKILSEKSKEFAKNNRELLSNRAIIALKNKKYKKTSIEKCTENKLKELNLNFKYNKILENIGQFDFIISDKILLEVNGDYWHANPEFYGDNKLKINQRQEYKIKRDLEKFKLASDLGYTIFYIWENDIRKENWKILYEIKEILNEQF